MTFLTPINININVNNEDNDDNNNNDNVINSDSKSESDNVNNHMNTNININNDSSNDQSVKDTNIMVEDQNEIKNDTSKSIKSDSESASAIISDRENIDIEKDDKDENIDIGIDNDIDIGVKKDDNHKNDENSNDNDNKDEKNKDNNDENMDIDDNDDGDNDNVNTNTNTNTNTTKNEDKQIKATDIEINTKIKTKVDMEIDTENDSDTDVQIDTDVHVQIDTKIETEKDKDELQSFLLRAKLSDMSFSYVWRVMHPLGWKWRNCQYITPFGMNLGSGIDTLHKLDFYALSFLSLRDDGGNSSGGDSGGGSNGDSNSNGGDNEKENIKLLKEARIDLLKSIFFNLDKDSRKFDTDSSEDDNDDSQNEESNDEKTTIAKTNDTTTNNTVPTDNKIKAYKSATMNEPGTEQFFGKRKSKRIKQVQYNHEFTRKDDEHEIENENRNSNDNDNDNEHIIDQYNTNNGKSKLVWPKPKDNVKAMIAMETKKHKTNDDNNNDNNNGNDNDNDNHNIQYVQQYISKNASTLKFLLSTNHCLLFHGFGSKKQVLKQFVPELQSCGDVLSIDGNDPDMNVSLLLDVIVQLFLDGMEPLPQLPISSQTSSRNNHHHHHHRDTKQSPILVDTTNEASIVQRASNISQSLGRQRDKPIYLLIHNIDGVQLRHGDSQLSIATLVANSYIVSDRTTTTNATANANANIRNGNKRRSCNSGSSGSSGSSTPVTTTTTTKVYQNERLVRLAATVDHVDSAMFLWDVNLLNTFSWIWKQIDTCIPYYEEVKMAITDESRKMRAFAQKEAIDYVFMQKVLKSIAPKHTEMLEMLATLQLSNAHGDTSAGEKYDYVELKEWKTKCYKGMVYSKENEFKSMMHELIDHRMIVHREDVSVGKDYICIPANRTKVREILKKIAKK